MDPSSYNTMRILAHPVMPAFYGDPNGTCRAADPRRAMYGSLGGYPVQHQQPPPVLVTGRHPYSPHQPILYSGSQFSTINSGMLKKKKDSTSTTTSLNALFTWKRKPKKCDPNCTITNRKEYSGQYGSAHPVPQSLARLFIPATGSGRSTLKATKQSDKPCICSGLTESTFKPPERMYYEDRVKTSSHKGTVSSIKSTATLRALSSDSLLEPKFKQYNTVNERKLNSAKSMEFYSNNRRSILECNVNPYELVLDGKTDRKRKEKRQIKSATVSVKSSRRATRLPPPPPPRSSQLSASVDQSRRKPLSIFNPANSIRIAGQSVYSNIKYDESFLVENESKHSANQRMHRSKSSGSLSSWSFDSTNSSPAPPPPPTINRLAEPEPDYDMEDELETKPEVAVKSVYSSDTKPQSFQSRTSSNLISYGKKLSSMVRPKVTPPPPPPNRTSGSVAVQPASAPSNPPPPPPPPPPPNYFLTSSTVTTSSQTTVRVNQVVKPKVQPIVQQTSLQNELKEKLNQGVKSILKKTNFSDPEWDSNGTGDQSTNSETSGEDSEWTEVVVVESQEPKPKKHVHFRVKRQHLNRSRSTSHIITETIQEEEDELVYYDDVAVPATLSRSVDDVSVEQQRQLVNSVTEDMCAANNIGHFHYDSSNCSSSNGSICTVDLSGDSLSSFDTIPPNESEDEEGKGESGEQECTTFTTTTTTSGHFRFESLSFGAVNVINYSGHSGNGSSSSGGGMSTAASPVPPPVPARRILLPTSSEEAKSKNSLGRTIRSYSTGSVRSLLARKLNRNADPRSNQSNGSKLNLSNLFSTNSNSASKSKENVKFHKSNRLPDHVDDHIYEELDSAFIESISGDKPDGQQQEGEDSKLGSFFGNRISRDEILDYLHDARNRLVVKHSESPSSLFGEKKDSRNGEDEDSMCTDLDVNNDSGNSSLCLADDGYADTLANFMAAKRLKAKCKKTAEQEVGNSSGSNRRNRASNVSNASSESSATSGVSVSMNLDDTEDDVVTTSNSSLGSVTNSTSYYLCGGTIERNDSGVGNELASSKSRHSEVEHRMCVDCQAGQLEDFYVYHQYLCTGCLKQRNERKEIISEIVDTELKYGRDLRIILEEFARPISVAGLLTNQQVDDIFLNLNELIEVNCQLADRLQDVLATAVEQGDEDLTTVCIGQLFDECLLAKISVFERYCIRQASASLLLNQLEKEKELLRIFLRVSQMENALLRRMNLRSFLVVPVQRVTKYPLLLNRLHKVTPHHYPDRDSLHDAQMKLELHLENINQKTRGSIAATTSKIWRRISNLSSASMRSRIPPNETDDFGFVRLKKMAVETLKWPREECRFVLIGKLAYIVEKSGTSTEQLNTYSSLSAYNSISNSNSNLTPNPTSTGNGSSASKIWSRSLKFSTANAVFLVRIPNTATPNTDSMNGNLDYSLEDGGGGGGVRLESEINDVLDLSRLNLSNNGTNNTASLQRRTKAPSRVNSFTINQPVQPNEKEAALMLIKEKNGRYVLCRDVLNLSLCVIANSIDFESEEFFEIHELESRESLLLKAESHSETKEWLEQLRLHCGKLGNWRKRRNALPNIMVLRNIDGFNTDYFNDTE